MQEITTILEKLLTEEGKESATITIGYDKGWLREYKYHGVIRKIKGDKIEFIDYAESRPKTFIIKHIQYIIDQHGEVFENNQLEAQTKPSLHKIKDPKAFFSDWHYIIDEPQYLAFGMFFREFMQDGKPYMSWAYHTPLKIDFQTGSVYKTRESDKFLQIIHIDAGNDLIEIHEAIVGAFPGQMDHTYDSAGNIINTTIPLDWYDAEGRTRTAWLLKSADLISWLYSGQRPAAAVQIDTCSNELLKFLVKPLDQPPQGGGE